MDITYEDNTQTAADPQAILTSPPKKLPISNNDPTRDISARQAAQRYLVMSLGVVALVAMALATLLMFVSP